MKWKRKRDNVWINPKLKMENKREKNSELIQIDANLSSNSSTHQNWPLHWNSMCRSTWIVFTCPGDHAFLSVVNVKSKWSAEASQTYIVMKFIVKHWPEHWTCGCIISIGSFSLSLSLCLYHAHWPILNFGLDSYGFDLMFGAFNTKPHIVT